MRERAVDRSTTGLENIWGTPLRHQPRYSEQPWGIDGATLPEWGLSEWAHGLCSLSLSLYGWMWHEDPIVEHDVGLVKKHGEAGVLEPGIKNGRTGRRVKIITVDLTFWNTSETNGKRGQQKDWFVLWVDYGGGLSTALGYCTKGIIYTWYTKRMPHKIWYTYEPWKSAFVYLWRRWVDLFSMKLTQL